MLYMMNEHKNILKLFNHISQYNVNRLTENNVDEIYNLEKTQLHFFEELHEKLTKQNIVNALNEVPPSKTKDDKYFLGFYEKNKLIAILDLVIKYPDENTAYIGLFMVDVRFCGQGVGSLIFNEIEQVVKNLQLTKIQLGYVDKNQQSKHFWLNKCGFVNTDNIKKEKNYSIQVCEKNLL